MADNSFVNNQDYNKLAQILDKGIEDMEAGRVLPVDEAFDIIDSLVERRQFAST